jgi:hypothetical protein
MSAEVSEALNRFDGGKARQGRTAGLVERPKTADGLRLTAWENGDAGAVEKVLTLS